MSADDGTAYRVDHEAAEDAESAFGGVEDASVPGLPDRPATNALASHADSARCRGVVIGRLIGFLQGQPLVTCRGEAKAMLARATVDLIAAHIGREVLLAFVEDRADSPVVVGWLRGDALAPEIEAAVGATAGTVEIDVDGSVLQIVAKDRLVLQCGEASITMTRAGKVLIRGRYVSSLSSGVNRIKGGSVQIN